MYIQDRKWEKALVGPLLAKDYIVYTSYQERYLENIISVDYPQESLLSNSF
jgi:hypothetical protein